MNDHIMSGEQPNNEPTPPDDPADVDIYCLHCGYNLRGLSGDPRRCPECGNMNPLGKGTIPEPVVAAELQSMGQSIERYAMPWCLGGILFAGWGLVQASLTRNAGSYVVIAATSGIVVLGLWLLFIRAFRSSCRGREGWGALAVKYNIFGLLIIVLAVAAVAPLAWAANRTFPAGLPQKASTLVVFVLFVMLLGIGNRALDRRLRRSQELLQRDLAIDRIKRRLQKRLTRPPRKGLLSRWFFGS